MGNIIKLSAILFMIAGLASGGLAYYNGLTKPVIDKLNAKNAKEARKYVISEGERFEEAKYADSDDVFFKAYDKDNNLIGYTFIAKEPGFSGVVETMVGIDTNFKIKKIKVLKHTETPGLGAETQVIKYGDTEPFFEGWFKDKNALKVVVEKDDKSSPDKVQSITGATITTRAVCKSINKYCADLKSSLEKGGVK